MAKAIKVAFMDKASAFKLADSIQRRGKVLDSDIQRAAVSAICYSIIHRDSTIGTKLVECFPAGSRKASLVAYFETHGNFALDEKTKEISFQDNKRSDDMAVLIPALALNTWITAKAEKIESIFVVEDYLESVAAKLDKKGLADLATAIRATRNGYIVATISTLITEATEEVPAEIAMAA